MTTESEGQWWTVCKSSPNWCCQDTLCGNLATPPVEIGSLYSQPLRVDWNYSWLGQEGLHSEASEALRDCSIFWNLAWLTEQACLAYQRRRDCMEKIPGTTADTSHPKEGVA